MNKNKIVTIILILLMVVLGIGILVLSRGAGEKNIIRSLFPIGGDFESGNNITPNEGGGKVKDEDLIIVEPDGDPTELLSEIDGPHIIYDKPVSGYTLLRGSTPPIVRVVEKETGHVIDIVGKDSFITISNLTRPGIQEVYWDNRGNPIVRFLDDSTDGVVTEFWNIGSGEKEKSSGLYSFSETLRVGDLGEAVRQLQITLNKDTDTQVSDSGPGSPSNETSIFGSLTKKAVIAFQIKYRDETFLADNLTEPDGVIKGSTLEKLNSLNMGRLAVSEIELRVSEPEVTRLDDVLTIAVSPDGRKTFLLKGIGGGSFGVITRFGDEDGKTIYNSPLKEWLVSWPTENRIVLNTKPSGLSGGYMYFLNAETGDINNVISEVEGLTTSVGPLSDIFIYTETRNSGKNYSTFVHYVNSQQSIQIDVNLFTDKCVWDPEELETLYCFASVSDPPATYPDDWYKGVVNFSDRLFFLQPRDLFLTSISDETGVIESSEIDVINPEYMQESVLLFMNKKDSKLWLYRF